MSDLIKQRIAEAQKLHDDKNASEQEAARLADEEKRKERERIDGIMRIWTEHTRPIIEKLVAACAAELQSLGGNILVKDRDIEGYDGFLAWIDIDIIRPISNGGKTITYCIKLFKSGDVSFARNLPVKSYSAKHHISEMVEPEIEKIIADIVFEALKP